MRHQNAICRLLWNEQCLGTGFLFSSDRRHILTANHVIQSINRNAHGASRRKGGSRAPELWADFRRSGKKLKIAKIAAPDGIDCHEDWAILTLEAPARAAPLQLSIPIDKAPFLAWGYPQILSAGLKEPENAVLTGTLHDVVPYHRSPFFKLVTSGDMDDCRGMSGAPVISERACVGILIAAHTNSSGKPIFGQLKACRVDGILEACSKLDIKAAERTVTRKMSERAWLKLAITVDVNLELSLPRGLDDSLSRVFSMVPEVGVILQQAMRSLTAADKRAHTIGIEHCSTYGAWLAWNSALAVASRKSPATLLAILFEARKRTATIPLLELAIQRLQREISRHQTSH